MVRGKVFKVAKMQWGDHVDHVETNPFRVDSTQWTGFRGKRERMWDRQNLRDQTSYIPTSAKLCYYMCKFWAPLKLQHLNLGICCPILVARAFCIVHALSIVHALRITHAIVYALRIARCEAIVPSE